MGECTKESAFELLDTFYDLGGNFIDTANTYQAGESELWIGEWLQKSSRRSEMVMWVFSGNYFLLAWQFLGYKLSFLHYEYLEASESLINYAWNKNDWLLSSLVPPSTPWAPSLATPFSRATTGVLVPSHCTSQSTTAWRPCRQIMSIL